MKSFQPGNNSGVGVGRRNQWLLLHRMYPNMVLYEMHTWDHVIAVIICVFAPILALTSRNFASEDIKLEAGDKIRLYHSNALLLTVFALIVTTTWRIPHRSLTSLGLDWPVWHPFVPIFLMIIALFYGLDIFLQYGSRKWRESTFQQKHKIFSFIPVDGKELIHFSLLAVAAGIGEEVVFRGYLIHYLIYWTGNTPTGILGACLFSSALFAFLHGYQGIKSMAKIFFIALMFCGIYIYSQSLLLVIVVHALIDIFSGILGVHFIRVMTREREGEEKS